MHDGNKASNYTAQGGQKFKYTFLPLFVDQNNLNIKTLEQQISSNQLQVSTGEKS
jgi:hypothetical protein